MAKVYAGIGSRRTPTDVLERMEAIAARLAEAGWVCRTGGAPGADQAFEAGARRHGDSAVELWLPWRGFEGREGSLPTPEAYTIAERYHPGWQYLKRGVRALMARDVHQVLGADLTSPVKMIICWTPDGSLDGSSRASGGTGMALRVACDYPVEVLNLQRPDHAERLAAWVESR
jgi:hypothetical protein